MNFGRLCESTKKQVYSIVSNNIEKDTSEIYQILIKEKPDICISKNQIGRIRMGFKRKIQNGKHG